MQAILNEVEETQRLNLIPEGRLSRQRAPLSSTLTTLGDHLQSPQKVLHPGKKFVTKMEPNLRFAQGIFY
jgi:hypothetical protein